MPADVEELIADTLYEANKNPGRLWGLWNDEMGWYHDELDRLCLSKDPLPIVARFYSLWQAHQRDWRPRMVEEWLAELRNNHPR